MGIKKNLSAGERVYIQHAIIVLVALLCYGDSLVDSKFVFDDTVAIVQNPDIIGLNVSVQQLFNHDFWGYNITDSTSHKSYRPLTTATFRLEYLLHNSNLNAFHMKCVNLLLHCIICCCILLMFRQFTNGKISFIATILFVVHPIHSEVVSGIVGRADLLCSVICLTIILIYLPLTKNADGGSTISTASMKYFQFLLISCLSIIALLCKETGITVLPLCFAYDLLINTNISRIIQCETRRFNLVVSFRSLCERFTLTIGGSCCLMYFRMWIISFEQPKFKSMDNPIAATDCYTTKILSQSFLYTLNAWLLMCPDWLSFDWALGSIQLIESFIDYRLYSIIALYIILLSLIVYGDGQIYLALSLIIIPFLPASGIIKVGFVIAERILYMPSIGYCLLIGIGYDRLCNYVRSAAIVKSMLYFMLFGVIMMWALKTRQRAHEWSSEQLLFSSAIRVCPNNAKIYYNIARLASDRHDRKTAFQYYNKAISLYPEYEAALMNLGNLYREQNDLETAEMYLLRAIKSLEEFPAAWMNLGIVQAAQHRYDAALTSYRKALQYRKRYATCHYNIGNLFIEQGKNELAVREWQIAVDINPKHRKAWANILAYLDNNGNTEQVLNVSQNALRTIPNDTAVLFTRANALGKLNRFHEAEQIYQQIIEIKPNYALYYVNLGVLYHRWNRKFHEMAIHAYRKALQIDPNLKSAQINLQKLERQQQ